MSTTTTASPASRPIEQAMGAALRLLTRFGSSGLVERFGLSDRVQRMVYAGTRSGLRAAAAAQQAARKVTRTSQPAERLPRPEAPTRFDLTLTDEQKLVRDTMRRFADDVLRPAAVAADEAAAPPADVLEQSHELGITMLAIPEALGGAAETRSPLSNALIAEDLARGDMALALATLAPLGVVNALVDWGTAEQQSAYLPRFCGDAFVPAALALLEPQPLFDPDRPRAGAVRGDDGGWILHGDKSLVPLGQQAELLVVAAQILGVGPRLFVVERGAPGLTVTPDPSMGLRGAGLARVRLDGVRVPDTALLGEPGRDGFDFAQVVDSARIAWGALATGACQAVLDYVITYCNDRHAFGEPITNRQSVAFMIADIAIELEGMRLLAYRAAGLAERGAPLRREAYLLGTYCADKAMKIGTDGVQLLGGHGFVKDHPVELWYRHLRALGVAHGALLI